MNYYEFKYDSKTLGKADNFGNKLSIFSMPFFVSMLIIYLLFRIEYDNKPWFMTFVYVILFISFVVGIYLVAKFNDSPKGVFVFKDYIEIDRHTVSKWHFSKQNFQFRFENIISCKVEKRSAANYGNRYFDSLGGSGKEFVMLTTDENKTYCFCIENQEEFVNIVNEKIKTSE